MELALLFAIIPLALGLPSITAPPVPTATCILGGNPCPTGSTCTQTETCRGQCIASPTSPLVIPCTVGNDGPCPTGSSCTPTMVCPSTPTPCGGQCIATPTFPPVIPCTVGNNGPCPTGSTCTPTIVCPSTPTPCGGQCIAMPISPAVISCIVGADNCPSQSICSQTMICGGLCISTPTISPTSTTRVCSGEQTPHCSDHSKCVRPSGKSCAKDKGGDCYDGE